MSSQYRTWILYANRLNEEDLSRFPAAVQGEMNIEQNCRTYWNRLFQRSMG